MALPLPHFPYHRDPIASQSVEESETSCDCCKLSRGFVYKGPTYCREKPTLCPWCVANGSAATKYGATFFDAEFVDDNGKRVKLLKRFEIEVFARTIGFATWNPIGWWVHCGEPAEYITRNEPYEMVFECRQCQKRHVIYDVD